MTRCARCGKEIERTEDEAWVVWRTEDEGSDSLFCPDTARWHAPASLSLEDIAVNVQRMIEDDS